MANGVNIPVNVTGDDEARRKLGAVGQAVGGVGGAVDDSGKKQEEANKNTQQAGELFEDYHRKAEKLVKQGLGMLNPQFAQMADLLFDINDGILRVTSGMLALAAAGAGIGIVVTLIQSMVSELERAAKELEEAEKKKRDQMQDDVKGRTAILDRIEDAGLSAEALPGVTGRIDQIMSGKAGFPAQPRERATELAIADVRKGGLGPRELAALAAGMLATDTEKLDWKDKKFDLNKLMDAGETPAALDALAADSAAREGQIEAERLSPGEKRGVSEDEMIEAAISRLVRERPELKGDERRIAMIRRAAKGIPESTRMRQKLFNETSNKYDWVPEYDWGQAAGDWLIDAFTPATEDVSPIDPAKAIQDLSAGQDIFYRMRERQPRRARESTQPLIINNTTNIATQVNDRGPQRMHHHPDLEIPGAP